MTMEDDSIEQAAVARRERLKALKAAKELMNGPDEDLGQKESIKEDAEETEPEEQPSMKFRNYLPHDKHLQESKLAPPPPPKFEDPVAPEPPVSEKPEDPFVNIAPKKPNWDLQRDVQSKLKKLEKRTQKAMFELMQEQDKERLALTTENGTVSSED
ncbi:hypothetical protein AMTRI_Chr09g31960 [Amborella trichopoda]|uniref:Coiled-coil domain-containing protein 12 n=1 Tax=Amborella trichopoda TaxID=13333 RepID=W1PSL5_AMBTC|nr:coiled-coil domain-containing protein 12 [Amborella trichopoda]XP_011625037.1 coiled-coil domain-containing protein 12 [Amborella trichopoda]XP_011625038.1 coiled-coil domain-containing protein 12 [Amborella trichopoda]XP_020525646.1 coiled-coil domain-containing protein 12 [Amborella trichopoda]ERN10240.1 hypothetical protein AMTR_s00171p00065800 [Amborella trichopoda]|eukprot:XP_006848659.1 coiled-coil domain-containing protein 12 [Amborella trichopoda]